MLRFRKKQIFAFVKEPNGNFSWSIGKIFAILKTSSKNVRKPGLNV